MAEAWKLHAAGQTFVLDDDAEAERFKVAVVEIVREHGSGWVSVRCPQGVGHLFVSAATQMLLEPGRVGRVI